MADPNGASNGNGRLNVTPLLTVLTVVLSGSGLFAGLHFGLIRPQETRLDRLERSFEDRLKVEQDRNNRLEREMGQKDAEITMLMRETEILRSHIEERTMSRFTKEDAQDLEARLDGRIKRLEDRQ